jgi:hypothetical protein
MMGPCRNGPSCWFQSLGCWCKACAVRRTSIPIFLRFRTTALAISNGRATTATSRSRASASRTSSSLRVRTDWKSLKASGAAGRVTGAPMVFVRSPPPLSMLRWWDREAAGNATGDSKRRPIIAKRSAHPLTLTWMLTDATGRVSRDMRETLTTALARRARKNQPSLRLELHLHPLPPQPQRPSRPLSRRRSQSRNPSQSRIPSQSHGER